MSSEKIIVFIKIVENSASLQSPILRKLNQNDRLSNIRKELENKVIDDTLLFSKKVNDEFGVLKYEEENFQLKEIIEVENEQNILYLKRVYWRFLSNQHKLDYGRIMSFDGIKIAKKQAYIINGCELDEIDSYKRGRLEFESIEDWMKKTNLFVDVDGINIASFAKLGLSVESLRNKSFNKEIMSAYKYTEIGKVSLKFSKTDLKLTEEFKNDVIDAIKSKNPREGFEKITEDYGQFIPTEVILGGRVYFNDIKKLLVSSADTTNSASGNIGVGTSNANVGFNFNNSERKSKFYNFNHIGLLGGKHPDDDENFDEKAWIESLKDYQNWDCIEFKNPISIFQLLSPDDLPDDLPNNDHLPDGLPGDLPKKIYKSIGNKILYTNIEECDYFLNKPGRFRTLELKNIPRNILRIIFDKKADIYATIFDTNEKSKNVFFSCQILRESGAKPSIIIHGIQKEFKQCRYKLKIKIMVIGYDTDFNSLLPDTSVELIKNIYDPKNPCEFYSIPLKQKLDSMLERNIPFFGIPVFENFDLNKSLIIGHNFSIADDENKIDIFSYCLEKKRYVNLPKVTFCTFIISNYPTSDFYESFPFNFKVLKKTPFVNLNTKSITPKCVSLYLSKNNEYKPPFLNQRINQIKVKYLDYPIKEFIKEIMAAIDSHDSEV
ncbi:hypothetical protein RhiirB3_426751 [Rhizophagus irregularis]|nr:hypothetical protein RhiirB3_426751 [Rhizophagus irregularis]